MRSRYSAYCLGLADYLLATWQPSTRPAELDLATPPVPRWIGLKVLHHRTTGPENAEVEFVARYRIGGRAHRLHETSRFVREEGRWLYVDGDIHPS
jgi:SEC-C motif-containing protein